MPKIASNKIAYHNYSILETLEAGLVLSGQEVKSIKSGHIQLDKAYISIDKNLEVWLVGAHVAPYARMSKPTSPYVPDRNRKLLVSKKQALSLLNKTRTSGLTILPLSVYTKGSFIKIEIGIARGKKKFDKREDLKKRDIEREIERRLRR